MNDQTPWLVILLGDASIPSNVFRILCKRCNETRDISLPIPVSKLDRVYRQTVKAHKECRESDAAN